MWESCVGAQRLRRLRRAVRHGRVTLLCLVLTVIVLRGTIGAGKFGTPQQDLLQIRNRFHSSRRRPDPTHRLLEELRTNPNPNPNPRVVSDWDEKRSQRLLRRNPSKPRVLMVTGSADGPCASPVGDRYLRRSLENKVEYGRVHGVEVLHGSALLEAETAGLRARARLVRRLLLSRPDVELLWWVDSDAVIVDVALEVPWERYREHNLVVHSERSWVGLESGSFMIRNCQWSLDILDAWAALEPSSAEEAMAAIERRKFDKDKVYLESEYYFNGGWDELDEESGRGFGDERRRRPLVAHLAGCKPCGKGGDYPDERCLNGMDRGFGFWDNQVVGM